MVQEERNVCRCRNDEVNGTCLTVGGKDRFFYCTVISFSLYLGIGENVYLHLISQGIK